MENTFTAEDGHCEVMATGFHGGAQVVSFAMTAVPDRSIHVEGYGYRGSVFTSTKTPMLVLDQMVAAITKLKAKLEDATELETLQFDDAIREMRENDAAAEEQRKADQKAFEDGTS